MRRREFVVALGGAAAWPFVAGAQQAERVRRIGALMGLSSDDPDGQAFIAALYQGLQEAGWVVGRNIRIDIRWSGGDVARLRRDGAELVAQKPDVIVAGYGPTLPILQQLTHTIPVVFTQSVDPVGGGFAKRMSRPGGNMTGFTQFEYGLSGKWFELLREISPQVTRVGVVRELSGPVAFGQWAVIQTFASPTGIEVEAINLEQGEVGIERAVSAFAPDQSSGLIVVVGANVAAQRKLIVALAARHKQPTVYFNRMFVDAGGLMSYGPNLMDGYRRAADYVDRILKGEKPADLPVQAPTKYELVINLKTAKALGLTVPPTLLARADEVIE
jgi:putative ABC transport system substrate-binding protein